MRFVRFTDTPDGDSSRHGVASPRHTCSAFTAIRAVCHGDGMRRLILLAMVLFGCESDPKMGEACDTISDALCRRAADCGIGEYNACFQGAKTACCLDEGTCDRSVKQSDIDALENECVPAILGLKCEVLATGTLPAVCLMSR